MTDATVLIRIPTGEIPGSVCPRCQAPLMVVSKRKTMYFGQAPQFVGCTGYPECGFVRTVSEDDRAIMEQVKAERELQPAEF